MNTGRNTHKTASSGGKPCPICKKPSVAAFQPFCSRRCADVDLGRWLNDNYVISGSGFGDDPDGEEE
ncbi:MAG: DNA gyrase inhibitor YacG [Parvularculales bacterium]